MGMQSEQGGQPAQQTAEKIDVFLKARGSGPDLEWDLGLQDPPKEGKEPIDVPPGLGRDIVFHLRSGGPGVNFLPSDPIWVQEGGNCPPKPGSTSGQVSVTDCKPNKLTIHDVNTEKRDLIYQLNFTGGAPPCDPLIRNGGSFA
ncbi:hypothetical protein ACFQPG_02990 [Sphingomonas sp. GCM10030256]|uniref:hypothetical protein n=1 Tax=Sphingomonas sp. GCM10030256 TaxID=3273427 RepID=UPI00361270D3